MLARPSGISVRRGRLQGRGLGIRYWGRVMNLESIALPGTKEIHRAALEVWRGARA